MKNIILLIVALGLSCASCKSVSTITHSQAVGFEKSILKELRTDLVQNLNDINSNIEGLKICEKANLVVINQIENDLPYHDSLDYHFANLYPYIVFSPNQTTFDYLKHKGLGIISNDSIRRMTSNLYGSQFGTYRSFEDTYFVEHYTNYIKPMFMAEFDTFEFYTSFSPRKYSQLIANKNYTLVMRYTIDACRSFIYLQYGLKETVEELISDIDIELKQ